VEMVSEHQLNNVIMETILDVPQIVLLIKAITVSDK